MSTTRSESMKTKRSASSALTPEEVLSVDTT